VKKTVNVEYDAARHSLQLVEPLEGVVDREKLQATIEKRVEPGEEPWRPFVGCMAGAAGDDYARVIDEMFPIER
jgi:hypothetical protein